MPDIEFLKRLARDRNLQIEEALKERPNFPDFVTKHPELMHTDCTCGREFSFERLHCPSCGRAPLYPMANKVVGVLPDGTEVMATKFRCRGCPRVYTDVEVFYNCKAKRPREKASVLKAKEEVLKFTGGMAADDLLKAIIERRKAAGLPTTDLEQKLKEKEPQPGTPEWYESHPEES